MQPTTSFWDNFSSEGRMKKLLAEALKETDPQKSLTRLRSLRQKLCEPPSFVQLWLPFLDAFLAEERVRNLNETDLADVEKMARSLQQKALREAPPAITIWQRLIKAHNARGEHRLACNLAEELYKDTSSDEQTRIYCLREMARQGRLEDRYINMYIAQLRTHSNPQKETEIFQALDTLFAIDSHASDARLMSVDRVAQSLLALSIPTLASLLPHLQHAALFLLVYFLRRGSWSQAGHYLKPALVGRTDQTAQLIRVYVEGREGQLDDAIQQGEQLATLGVEKAYYILGNLYFYKAVAEPQQAQQARLRSALVWQRLQASAQGVLPADLPALAACASFIAYPQQRATSALTLIQTIQTLDRAQRQPWLEWHVALALLWYGTPQSLTTMYATLLHTMDVAGRADDATVATLALALIRFTYKLKESPQQFLELLEHFAQQSIRPASKQIVSSAIIVGQRALYLSADEQQRAQIEESLRRHLARDPHNGLLLLWQVCIALRNHKHDAAMLLQSANPDDRVLAYLSQALLNLLKQSPLASNITLPTDAMLTDLSRDALNVAQLIASDRVQEAYDVLLRQNTDKVLATWRIEGILPPLCIYIQQKGVTPPAFLTGILHSWHSATLDDMVRLAWCASLLGNVEEACRLWEEVLHNSSDDEKHSAWRQDFVYFLCRQAVSESTAGQGLEAANHLRLAASWTTHEFGRQLSQERLLEHARILELRVLTTRLLTYLFPDFASIGMSPGRYHALGLTLARSTELIEALLSRDRERIQQEWKKTLQAQSDNMRFLHTLSVLYREIALSKQAQHLDTEKDWLTSTALWILLFSTEAFWQYFAEERGTGAQDGQQKLSTRQREEIWQDARDNILIFHSTIARKSFAAGEQAEARIHARCLALGRQSAQRLVKELEQVDLAFPVNIEQKRVAQIKNQAQRLLNEWGQSLLTEAEKNMDDVNAIEQLPRGIRKHYAGGIGVLIAFIRLDVPLIRILLTCLDWYNQWCDDLNLNGPQTQYRETAEAASTVCEKLQRRCDKKNVYAAENKAIILHLTHRGIALANREPERAIHFYEEAITWGSDNPNLDTLLGKARLQSVEAAALQYANNQQFEDAYQAITQAEPLIKEQDAVRNLRMRISFRHARELVAQEKYTEALSRGKQALALEPTNTILKKFIQEVEELIPEEGYGNILHEAEQALEKQDFSQALQQLARISPGSRFFQQAQDMRKQALDQQKIASISRAADEEILDQKKFAEREAHLRLILAPGKTDENRAKAREELSALLARRASSELKQAKTIDEQQSVLRHSRFVYASSLAEEAFELDPRNTIAKQALEELRKLLEPKNKEKEEEKA